jgi:AcrR family transcriptional regulator
MPRSGRRPGPNTTRAAILDAARRRFADVGYDATSIRAVAADAAVDPAVVMHFFSSKEGLFQAVVGWPFDPAHLAARITAAGSEPLAARVARTFLEVWEDPAMRTSLLAVLRSTMTRPAAAGLLREYAVHQLVGRLGHLLEGPDVKLRLNLAASQLIGVAVLRYVLHIDPIASASIDQLVAWLTPALTHYFGPAQPDEMERTKDAI